MKRHYEEHGYTEGYEGCARLSAGMKGRPHSNVCRERMYKEMEKTEDFRKLMKASEARMNECLEEKVRKDHEEKDEAERRERQAEAPKGNETERDAASLAGQLPSGATADPAPSGGVPTTVKEAPEKTARCEKKKTKARQRREARK